MQNIWIQTFPLSYARCIHPRRAATRLFVSAELPLRKAGHLWRTHNAVQLSLNCLCKLQTRLHCSEIRSWNSYTVASHYSAEKGDKTLMRSILYDVEDRGFLWLVSRWPTTNNVKLRFHQSNQSKDGCRTAPLGETMRGKISAVESLISWQSHDSTFTVAPHWSFGLLNRVHSQNTGYRVTWLSRYERLDCTSA